MPDAPLVPGAATPPSLPAKGGRRSHLKAARAAMEASADGTLSRIDVESVVAKTRRGLRAAAPHLLEAAIEKALLGKASKGDRAMLIELLRASGVSIKGATMTEAERRAIDAENERLDALPPGDLSRRIHERAGVTPVPEPMP